MKNRVQEPTEGVREYFYAKDELCVDCSLDFEETKEQIIIGLHSHEIKGAHITKWHEDEDELLHDLIQMERI